MSTREYHSPLRDAQSDATRERVLDAAINILVEEGAGALTQRAIARRAEVSAPTVARYLPDADAIVAELDARITERLGIRTLPDSPEGLFALIRTIYLGMEREERVMRAYLAAPASRTYGRTRRRSAIERAFGEALAPLGEPDARQVMAVLQLFTSATTWSHLREVWGLDGEQAAQAAHWAIRALFETALRVPPSQVPLPRTKQE